MASETEPLLARRPSSHDDREAAEEDALLTGQAQKRSYFASFSDDQWKRLREVLAFIWAFLATIVIIILAVLLQHSWHHPTRQGRSDETGQPGRPPPGKKNLIFMVSDGMGPSSLSLTRSFNQLVSEAPYNQTLFLDSLLIGQSRTRSSNSLVTDSAAGATAFSCGEKSYNGAISMLPDGTPCPSVMEAAKRAGYMTGVVVTTRVTDATPACFGSHVRMRIEEDSIAEQLTGLTGLGTYDERPMDLILGGGRCHFLSNTTSGSCRLDDTDVTSEAQSKGWTYLSTRDQFNDLSSENLSYPVLGLFAEADIPFELDRRQQNTTYPSLPEMAQLAIDALTHATKDSDQGFFLMIEGSRIDHAGHINDPAAQVHEVLSYDETVRLATSFARKSSIPTLVLGTSDHETGGLAIARQDGLAYPAYGWYPAVLANASHSAEWAAATYQTHLLDPQHDPKKLDGYLTHLVRTALGFEPSADEVQALIDGPVYAIWTLAGMISRRAGIGWSTHGHSAADVNIYSSVAHGYRHQHHHHQQRHKSSGRDRAETRAWHRAVRARIAGNRENTDVGSTLAWWLGVEREMGVVGGELNEGRTKGVVQDERWASTAFAEWEVESGRPRAEFELWRRGRWW